MTCDAHSSRKHRISAHLYILETTHLDKVMYKVKNQLAPSSVAEIFRVKKGRYSLRNSDFDIPRFQTVGLVSIRYVTLAQYYGQS